MSKRPDNSKNLRDIVDLIWRIATHDLRPGDHLILDRFLSAMMLGEDPSSYLGFDPIKIDPRIKGERNFWLSVNYWHLRLAGDKDISARKSLCKPWAVSESRINSIVHKTKFPRNYAAWLIQKHGSTDAAALIDVQRRKHAK